MLLEYCTEHDQAAEVPRWLYVLILDDDPLFGRQLELQLRFNSGAEFAFNTIAVDTAAAAYAAVQSASIPFDVFLIDQRLGPGPDGVDVLYQLRVQSPTSDAIVFTLAGDFDAARRAHQAGAYRYLHKPFRIDELLLVLQTLSEWRQTRAQRDWLQVINRIAEDAQRLYSHEKIEQVIVERGLEFGFDRAYLWLSGDNEQCLRGAAFAGDGILAALKDERVQVNDSPYLQEVSAAHELVVFDGLARGETLFMRRKGTETYLPPQGEWVGLPLRAGQRLRGILMLDQFKRAGMIRGNISLHEALGLFARQAAAALERAYLYEAEQRKNSETKILAEIGHLISSKAAPNNGLDVLEQVRAKVGRLLDMDVSTFFIAMRNEVTDFVELLIDVEDNKPQELKPLQPGKGLVRCVIEQNHALLFATLSESRRFCREHDIKTVFKGTGKRTQSWLGVPLQVEGHAVGAIVVQSIKPHLFDAQHRELLTAVAQQIAGPLHSRQLRQLAENKSTRLSVFQQATQALMQLEDHNDDHLWHTALTVITAGYGLEFNLAALFTLTRGATRLDGRLGIGHRTLKSARQDWEKDSPYDLNAYLQQLQAGLIQPTPVDRLVKQISIDLTADAGVFGEVLQTKRRMRVSEQELESYFPAAFRERFLRDRLRGIEYEIAPILVGDRPIGVILVGNPHLRRRLGQMPLDELDTWLSQIGVVHESWRQRRAGAQLAAVSQSILARASERPLSETLTETCETARVLMGASSTMIIPLDDRDETVFDLDSAGYDGLRHPLHRVFPAILDPFTLHVISGDKPLPIINLHNDALLEGPHTRELLEREGIQACIIAPLRDRKTRRPGGLLLINYRRPRTFTDYEIEQACSFAGLASEAIRSNRVSERSEAERRERDRELAIISEVLKGALELNIEQPEADAELARLILRAVEQLLEHMTVRAGLIRRVRQPITPGAEPHELRKQYFLIDNELQTTTRTTLDAGITGVAFTNGTDLNVADVTAPEWRGRFENEFSQHTRSELDVLIHYEGRVLGLINVESPDVAAFQPAHHQALRRLADVAAITLESIRTQQQMRGLLYAAEPMIAAQRLQPTLERVLKEIRKLAPELSAVTIWYWDESRKSIRRGPCFGVHYTDRFGDDHAVQMKTVLGQVLDASAPIWSEHVVSDERFAGRFAHDEAIVACAAFPLRAVESYEHDTILSEAQPVGFTSIQNLDQRTIGALFLSYRHQHIFTRRERVLFPMLAAIVAACIRDAIVLEQLAKERHRLNAALDVTRAIGTKLDLDTTLTAIMATLRLLFEKQSCTVQICVLTCDDRDTTLRFTEASRAFYDGHYIDQHTSFPIDVPDASQGSIAARVARRARATGQAILENIADIGIDQDYVRANDATRSQLSLALLPPDQSDQAERKLLGVLVIESNTLDAFDHDDELLIEGIGNTISLAIERIRRTTELLAQRDQLRFSNTVLTRYYWAAELAHDFKRDIGLIRNRLDWIKEEPCLSEDSMRSLAELEARMESLAKAANASRYDTSDTIALDEWLATTMDGKIRDMIASRNGDIVFDLVCNASQLSIQASVYFLEYAIRSIVSNALDAMGECGILRIITEQKDAQYCEVSICNSGTPPDAETRKKLLQDPVSTKGSERGYGLLFVRSYLETIQGSIRLLDVDESQETTFVLRLPIYQHCAAQSHEHLM